MNYANIISAMCSDVWLIDPEKLDAILEVLNVRMAGGSISDEGIAAAAKLRHSSSDSGVRPDGDVAVIGLYGTITQRPSLFDSGGTSTEGFSKRFDAAVNDPSVSTIVIDVDSPGGNVYGVQEVARKVFDARKSKRIIAVANSMAASAAYWIGTAADELIVTPGGDVGSVGVICIHSEGSKLFEKEGVKNTIIRAGKYKAELNPYEPLTGDAQDNLQSRVDDIYSEFVKVVAKHRGVSVGHVRENFGQGRMKGAKQAVASKMADAVATLDEVISELVKNPNKSFITGKSSAEITGNSHIISGDFKMPEKTESTPLSAKILASEHPDVHTEVFEAGKAAGAKDEKERFAAIQGVCPDAELAAKCFTEGKGADESKMTYLEARTEQLTSENEQLKSKKPETKPEAKVEGAPAVESSEEGGNGGQDFMIVAKARAKDDKISVTEAMRLVASEQPDLHKAFKNRK